MPLKIVYRDTWGASKPKAVEALGCPVASVVMHYHSDSRPCESHGRCRVIMKNLQEEHHENKSFSDIEHNFYIAGDGMVYEGRGWTSVSVAGDPKSIHFAYMGEWDKAKEIPEDMEKLKKALIEEGINLKHIKKKYKYVECKDPSSHPPPTKLDDHPTK